MFVFKRVIKAVCLPLFCVVLVAGCASGPQLVPAEALKANFSPSEHAYDASLVTGGLWVEGEPLMVNSEFDFGLAMSVENVGPAIAAGTRRRTNEEHIEAINKQAPLAIAPVLNRALRENLKPSDPFSVVPYVLLYGKDELQLIILLTLNPAEPGTGKPRHIAYLGQTKTLQAWVDGNGELLKTATKKAAKVLAVTANDWLAEGFSKKQWEDASKVTAKPGRIEAVGYEVADFAGFWVLGTERYKNAFFVAHLENVEINK